MRRAEDEEVAQKKQVLAAVALLFAARAAAREAEQLTLEQALALALRNSAAVLSAEMQVQRADDDLAAARTRRLPSFEVQAQANQLLTPIEVTFPAGALGYYEATGPIPSRDTVIKSSSEPSARMSATIAQPITGLHKAGLAAKASRLSKQMEQQQLRAQRAAVANDVRRLYYAVLQLEGAADAAREQVKALREMNVVVGRFVALETALAYEGMEVKARLLAEEYRLINLENAVESQKELLNTLFGRDPRTLFEVVAVPAQEAVEEVDLQAAYARATSRRPELQKANLQVELADTDRRIKKAESIPTLNLVASYDSFFNQQLLPSNPAQLGIQFKWEPFDWGRKRKELASKTLAVEQAQLLARDQKNRVLAEVSRAFRQVQEARALVAMRRISHDGAREKVRVVLLRGAQQSALVKDVLSAQAALADARAQYDEAQLSLWQARADLDKAMGEDR
jgi:outer membrane protein